MNELQSSWYEENVAYFRNICPQPGTTEILAQSASYHRIFTKSQYIFQANDPVKSIFLLEEGRVKIGSYSDTGKEIIKAILQPGDIFGEQVLLGGERHRNFAQAVDQNVHVCALSLSDLRKTMAQDPEFGMRVTQTISMRVRQTERRLEALVSKDARTRIIEFLRDLADENGKPVGDEILIHNFLTHKDIASLTATSRQTVTSVLNDLREHNLIYFDRKRLLIRSIERLMASVKPTADHYH